MSKINIKVTIENDDQKQQITTNAIIQDNILKYKEENNTIVKFNYLNNNLIRENNDIYMDYKFKKGISKNKLLLKKYNKELIIDINTTKIEKTENDIEIDYIIEKDEFKYKIEVIK